jgi:cell division septum initiation protein DivIVA
MAPDRKNPDKSSLATAASDQIRAIIEAAEQTAAEIRAEAEAEATRIVQQAEEEATGIRSQAQGDVHALLDSIRSSVSRLSDELEQLDDMLKPAAAAKPAPEPAAPAPTSPRANDADLESARLVAFNMALDGNSSREDIDRYLSENYELSDRQALLDEVYATLGG